jgi:transcriptional regulator with XRE-family HTH domain
MTFDVFIRRVAKNVKKARLDSKLTQRDIEDSTGIAVRHYQTIESGRANCTLKTLYLLSKAFKMDPADLIK